MNLIIKNVFNTIQVVCCEHLYIYSLGSSNFTKMLQGLSWQIFDIFCNDLSTLRIKIPIPQQICVKTMKSFATLINSKEKEPAIPKKTMISDCIT